MFNKQELDYLTFDDDFDINISNKSKFILGPNGIGKSSIYKNIKINHPEYSYIDYSDLRNSIIAKKKKLYIGSSLKEIELKQNEKNQLIGTLDIKGNIRISNINKKSDATDISDAFNELYDDYEKSVLNFEVDNLEILSSLSDINQNFVIKNYSSLLEILNTESEIENIKNIYIKEIFEKLDLVLDENECICPICSSTNERTIKLIIREKLEQITTVQNNMIGNYQKLQANLSPENIIREISDIKQIIEHNNITINNIVNFVICGRNIEKVTPLVEAKNSVAVLNSELNRLETERIIFYNNLRDAEDDIVNIFSEKYDVDRNKIVFDDEEKLIRITLKRNVETYSTGEINMLVFVINLYEFIANNKTILVIDDPLTSYDITNQYKMIFELVNALKNNKKAIIFTHNINSINIANTQHRGVFEFQYIEKKNGILYLNNCNIGENDSLLNIENLIRFISTDDQNKNYFKLLVNKDSLPIDDDLHKIFHYDMPFQKDYEGETLNNDYLVGLIDNFPEDGLENINFEQNSIRKIIYLSAIRTWIEKKFFDYHPNEPSLANKMFGEKINYLFPSNGAIRWNGPIQITRSFLMSKKVMINQNSHYKSQILPFHYATNLSLEDLSKEIKEIKTKFN